MLRLFCKIGDRELGPFSPDELKEMASAGELAPEDLVRRETEEEWISARRLKHLTFGNADPRNQTQPSDATGKNKTLNERNLSRSSAPPNLPDVKAPEAEAGANQPQLIATWKAASLRFLKWALGETVEITEATLNLTIRLVKYGEALWQRRFLRKEARRTKLALGEKVFQLGFGDEQLRRQIDALNDRVESLKVVGSSIKPLESERRGLQVRLATTVMVDDEPTQLEPEYSAAVNAQDVLQGHDEGLSSAGAQLLPPDGTNWVRICVGYGTAFAFLFLLVGFLFLAEKNESPRVTGVDDEHLSMALGPFVIAADDKRLSAALGLVVSGAKVVNPDGSLADITFMQGSCFAVSPDGYLLTNRHLVEPVIKLRRAALLLERWRKTGYDVKPKVWVFFGKDHKYSAEITHTSDDYDLCVLKIDATALPVFRLSSANDLPRTTRVYACGFPAAAKVALSVEEISETIRRFAESKIEETLKIRDFEYITTSGTVSWITSEQNGRTWVQHNADINPGNSGGPLITEHGTVVGINTLLAENASGTFFATMLSQMKAELDEYIPNIQWE